MKRQISAWALLVTFLLSFSGGTAIAAVPAAFDSPDAGFAALANAVRSRDPIEVARVVGDEGRRLLYSGDDVADAAAFARFVQAYDQRQTITHASPDVAVLQVGPDAWPLPIPMRRNAGVWRFDPRMGGAEIIARRIGRNELDTIETLRAIADAQAEYADTAGRDGPFRAYTRRFVSTPGTRDGLYWESAPGAPPSPLGPFVAARVAEGYSVPPAGETPRVIHGYLYRILETQGPSAPGGAMSYLVQGRMVGGFAVVACPVTYASSGVQTFISDASGEVWQRDLGPRTTALCSRILAFDPSREWAKVSQEAVPVAK